MGVKIREEFGEKDEAERELERSFFFWEGTKREENSREEFERERGRGGVRTRTHKWGEREFFFFFFCLFFSHS